MNVINLFFIIAAVVGVIGCVFTFSYIFVSGLMPFLPWYAAGIVAFFDTCVGLELFILEVEKHLKQQAEAQSSHTD
jgi:hypothetical protein